MCWQAVTGRTTLSALLDMLAEAAAMGAGKSDLMDKLQSRADSARAFETKAAPCLATVEASFPAAPVYAMDTTSAAAVQSTPVLDSEAAADSTLGVDTAAAESTPVVDAANAALRKVSLAELEALVQEGQGIGIKLDSLTDLTRLLNSARAWAQQAEFCLTGKELHTAKNKKHPQRPSLEQATSLMAELPGMAVVLPLAEELCSKQQQAMEWVDKARGVLEQGNLGQRLGHVQAVVDEGTAFGLQMPELTQLDALVRAIQWNSMARSALRLAPEVGVQSVPDGSIIQGQDGAQAQTAQESHSHRGSPAPAGPSPDPSIPPPSASDLPLQQQTSQLQVSSSDAHPGSQQTGASSAAPPNSLTSGGAQGLPMCTAGVTPLAERLTLAEAEELFEQGGELPVEEPVLQRLQVLVETGLQWEAQASTPGSTYACLFLCHVWLIAQNPCHLVCALLHGSVAVSPSQWLIPMVTIIVGVWGSRERNVHIGVRSHASCYVYLSFSRPPYPSNYCKHWNCNTFNKNIKLRSMLLHGKGALLNAYNQSA